MKSLFAVFVALGLLVVPPAIAMPTLQIDGTGKLSGAIGVDVGGTLYDVMFMDGTCAALFSGCDANSDFFFDEPAAFAASEALLLTVFLDSSLGDFDSDPSRTLGCENAASCVVATPYTFDPNTGLVGGAGAFNENDQMPFFGDQVTTPFIIPTVDLQQSGGTTWALWKEHVPPGSTLTPVPEPTTMMLLATGLFGVVGYHQWRERLRKRP